MQEAMDFSKISTLLNSPHAMTVELCLWLKVGEDSKDALSCRSFFAKEPLLIGLFCVK